MESGCAKKASNATSRGERGEERGERREERGRTLVYSELRSIDSAAGAMRRVGEDTDIG